MSRVLIEWNDMFMLPALWICRLVIDSFFFFCEQASVKDDESPKKDEPKFQAFSGKSYSLKR